MTIEGEEILEDISNKKKNRLYLFLVILLILAYVNGIN